MANKWKIPEWPEKEVLVRNKSCVYCGVKFKNNSRNGVSWEHANNKSKDVEKWNIVLCCQSCNSSNSVKNLSDCFESPHCLDKHISKKTVANIIRKYITDKKGRSSLLETR